LLSEDQQALMILGRVIREAREQRGLSVEELALATGVTPGQIESLEAGQHDPPYHLILIVANALSVRLSAIAKRTEELERQDESQ
jgi:transcriptional regulator with XRE-family HTH domain